RAGHFKPPMGLEEMTSGNDITFIERAAATSAFTTGEITGAGAFFDGGHLSLAGGLFRDDAGRQSPDDEAWSAATRLTAAPWMEDNAALHVGASAAWRAPDSATDTLDLDAYADNALQTTDSVSAVIADAQGAAFYG